jgi:hypothetical protein
MILPLGQAWPRLRLPMIAQIKGRKIVDKEITVRQACLMRLATWAPARGESKVQLYDLRVNDLGAILQPLADAERLVCWIAARSGQGQNTKRSWMKRHAFADHRQWRLIASAVLATEWPERMARESRKPCLTLSGQPPNGRNRQRR